MALTKRNALQFEGLAALAGLTALVIGLVLSSAGLARGHLGHVVSRAERYIKVDVEPEAVRVVVSLSLGPSETLRIMRDADADRDGELSPEEVEAYMVAWADGLQEELPIAVDGELAEVTWGDAYFDPSGPVQAAIGAVELVAHVPLTPGEHTLTLRDRMRVETFDRTDVAFHSEQGGTLLTCGLSEAPTDCNERFAYDAQSVPPAITATVRVEGLTDVQRFGLFGGLALVAVGALVSWWRVARRRRG